jgi:hypothetical protein
LFSAVVRINSTRLFLERFVVCLTNITDEAKN